MEITGSNRIGAIRRLLVIFLLAQLLLAVAGASAPAIHKLLHHDADDAAHECAITLIATGGIESIPNTVFLSPIGIKPVSLPFPASARVASIHSLSRVLEHAPPQG